jgi:glycosyltransferase involved in cell wall biosynthesis
MSASGKRRIVAAIPVLDDWESLAILLERLDAVAARESWSCAVLAIDDGSADPGAARCLARPYAALESVEVLQLARNLGHQRAIAIGLSFLHEERSGDVVVVMDGDGEDRPEDIPRLLEEYERQGASRVVFAQRSRRSEGLAFRLCYQIYRLLHWILTGIAVRVGNFSLMPFERLATFVVVSRPGTTTPRRCSRRASRTRWSDRPRSAHPRRLAHELRVAGRARTVGHLGHRRPGRRAPLARVPRAARRVRAGADRGLGRVALRRLRAAGLGRLVDRGGRS